MLWIAALRAARKMLRGCGGICGVPRRLRVAGWSGVCRGCRGGPWPSRGPCGGAGSPGRCEHRPLQGFVLTRGRGRPGWPKAQNLFVGAGFIPPAGAFRRPTAAQRRLLGRRSRPRNLAAALGPPGRCEHRLLQRFVVSPGSHFPGWPPRFLCPAGRAFTPTAPAGAGR